jgi:hypothetical protein
MNKWILPTLIAILTVGFILILFRNDLPIWKDIYAMYIGPTVSRTVTWAKMIVLNNPLEWFMGSIGGIVAGITGITKLWGALGKKKEELTTTVNQMQNTLGLNIEKLQEEKQVIIDEKTALFDSNTTLTAEVQNLTGKLGTIPILEQDLAAMTQQYEDARTQLQTLHDYQSKIDTEKIGQMLADAQRVK